jgi:hypothetical protein
MPGKRCHSGASPRSILAKEILEFPVILISVHPKTALMDHVVVSEAVVVVVIVIKKNRKTGDYDNDHDNDNDNDNDNDKNIIYRTVS